MKLENIIKALCEIMEFCQKKGVDVDEDENLQRAAILLDNEIETAFVRAGKTQREVERVRGYIVSGNKQQAIKEGENL